FAGAPTSNGRCSWCRFPFWAPRRSSRQHLRGNSMSIVRFEVTGGKSAPARSTPEGTGEVLVQVNVETDIAETERGRGLGTHQRDVVVGALMKIIAAVQAGGKAL